MKKQTYMTPEAEIYWLFEDIITASASDGYEQGVGDITKPGKEDIIIDTPDD